MSGLSSLPSVEELLQTQQAIYLVFLFGRPFTLHSIREVLNAIRKDYLTQPDKLLPNNAEILKAVRNDLESSSRPTLVPLINATGVILHTNLGRAPLSLESIQAMDSIAKGYSNLEFDLPGGKRGSRLIHAEKILQQLLGVEAALVVNNNASAVLLALSALANRKRVIVSRTQLVEIGGGFRVPDVMRQSGARIIEIGTTNQVHLQDYEQALQESTGMIMHVHRSNFKLSGYTSEPSLAEIAHIAHQYGVILLDDLGSGSLLATEKYGLGHEPTVQESLEAGADLVCFSGDKLLGGPQAGLLVGKKELISKIKKHPLARVVRADKLCLAALSATLFHYLKDEAESKIPIWRMISIPLHHLRVRTDHWIKDIGAGEVIPGESTIGGGSLPEESLPTWLLALDVKNPDRTLRFLRSQDPAIIARTERNRILLDPRTVLPENENAFILGIKAAIQPN